MTLFDFDQVRTRLVNAEGAMIRSKYDYVFKTKVLKLVLSEALNSLPRLTSLEIISVYLVLVPAMYRLLPRHDRINNYRESRKPTHLQTWGK